MITHLSKNLFSYWIGACAIKLFTIAVVIFALFYKLVSLKFVGKARSLPLEWNAVKGSTLVGSSLPTNIRIGWKRAEVANTLAYYDTATISAFRSFVLQDFVPPNFMQWETFRKTVKDWTLFIEIG